MSDVIEAPVELESTDATQIPEFVEPETPDESASEDQEGQVKETEAKPELTDAEREARALKRRVDRLTREKYELRAQLAHGAQLESEQGEPRALSERDVNVLAEQRAKEITEQRAFDNRCNEVYESGMKLDPKFDDHFRALSEEIGAPFENGRPSHILSAILDTDAPEKVINHLALHPDLAAELADLTPARQIRRLAQIERDMQPALPKVSNAPSPIRPIGSKGTSATTDPEKMSFTEFKAHFNKRHTIR